MVGSVTRNSNAADTINLRGMWTKASRTAVAVLTLGWGWFAGSVDSPPSDE